MTFEVFCYGELVAKPVDTAAWKRVVEKLNGPGGAYPIVRGEQIEDIPTITVWWEGEMIYHQKGAS